MKKETITLSLKEIIPYEKNAKKHADKRIEESIKEYGYIAQIIVDENNIIIAGHGRLNSLKKLKYKEVEVVKVSGLTEKQKKDYRIKDNKITELGDWDFDLLNEEFEKEELIDFGFDIDLSGDDEEDLSEKNKEINESDLADESVFKLKYTQEDYYKLLQKLNELRESGETNENIIYKLIMKSDV